jgi:hypothetical protein
MKIIHTPAILGALLLTSCAIFEKPPEVVVDAFRMSKERSQKEANARCMGEYNLPLATFKAFTIGQWNPMEPASLYTCSDPNKAKK